MRIINQSQSGKAFEYGIAYQLAKRLGSCIVEDVHASKAYKNFIGMSEDEKRKIELGSLAIVRFLLIHDKNLSRNDDFEIRIQPDSQGQVGDVRDIIIHNLECHFASIYSKATRALVFLKETFEFFKKRLVLISRFW